jgi:hypothetical protein
MPVEIASVNRSTSSSKHAFAMSDARKAARASLIASGNSGV